MKRGTGDVPKVLENRDDEQMAVRQADASGGYFIENHDEENRMRDIQVGTRPEAASEEQPDKLRKTARFEQEGETPSRPGSALVQKSGHGDGDVHISALDAFFEMDGRKSRYIGEVLEWYRGEDAGDLKRSELHVLVENWRYLNDPGKFLKLIRRF